MTRLSNYFGKVSFTHSYFQNNVPGSVVPCGAWHMFHLLFDLQAALQARNQCIEIDQ